MCLLEQLIHLFSCSNLLSNDTQMRCNFVDLYHALYGLKRPPILCAPEMSAITSALPRIPKLSDKHRSVSPCEAKPAVINVIESTSREATQLFKREPELNVEDDHCSINEDQPELIKVRFYSAHSAITDSIHFWCYRLIHRRRTTKRQVMPRQPFGRQMPRKWKPNFVRTIRCRCLELYRAVLARLALNRACSRMRTKTVATVTPNRNRTKISRSMANRRWVQFLRANERWR